jgi:hypothetical protein
MHHLDSVCGFGWRAPDFEELIKQGAIVNNGFA